MTPSATPLTPCSDLHFAVVEHLRSWLTEDGPLLQEMKRKDGKLDGVTGAVLR